MANFGKRQGLKRAVGDILKARETVLRASEGVKELPADAEWLMDNAYIAQREGRAAMDALRHEKVFEIFGAAHDFIEWAGGELSAEKAAEFLNKRQENRVLAEKELAAFPAALRLELINRLAAECPAVEKRMSAGGAEPDERPIGALFTGLMAVSAIDFYPVLESVNRTEALLRQDPAGVYEKMDDATRAEYRRRVAELARKRGDTEYETAKWAIGEARKENVHIGRVIFAKKKTGADKGGAYIAANVVITSFLTLLAGFLAENALITLLLLLPISETVKNVIDSLLLRLVKPRCVPRMEPDRPIPDNGRTLCVVSALLSSETAGEHVVGLLEQYRLANRVCGDNLRFAILADLPEGKNETEPNDKAKTDKTKAAVDALNAKYGGGFVLLMRPRAYARADGIWMGWERKRGAILELMRRLRGGSSGVYLAAGSMEDIERIKYVITLDSDTRLNVGAAGEMTAAMLHPMNRPRIKNGVVVSGHGLLTPRIGTELRSAAKSDFARIFAGQGGVDPYGSRASDLYFDIYSEGSYTGKGIIDVDAYLECIEGRFPENAVLSHDLLEGAYLRCGYIGDVELSDGFPARAMSYYERLHRWIRGDWQASPWLFPKVRDESGRKAKNILPQLDRWKLFDNLRRSLVPASAYAALKIGMVTNGFDFLLAGAVALLSAASGLLIALAAGAVRQGGLRRRRFHASLIHGAAGVIMSLLIKLTMLPYKAALCFGAAMTALYRMLISKKNMLKWVTAADSELKNKGGLAAHYRKMWPSAAAGALAIAFSVYPFGAAIGILWLLAPAAAFSLSRERAGGAKLSRTDKLYLTRCAGDIWRYFKDFLNAGDNFLPPDNVQEEPDVGTAHRTSPTNIGLAMLSVLAASDMGLAGMDEAGALLDKMLLTVENMPKWKGHLYNWYDTRTLRPLSPPYVSTVDGGNMAGCLIVLKQALEGVDDGLAERADKLLRAMDFSLLFDEKRRLFRIGVDPERESQGNSFYDLMASEARLTSYIAVALGQVPRKHWRRLGRAQVSLGGYSGMASWTGTMFEYLMPNLVMPCYENSLIWESVKFCIYVQKKCAGRLPWGVSESAYYALDAGRSYRYKAHGMAALALKRGMGAERVISPYSTFLTLPWCGGSAVKNLKSLAEYGAEGRWGFMEALDFTPTRMSGGEPGHVRTYMAHHLGMSLISVCNTLLGGIMQKRFMENSSMAAYAELLQEKVPVGERVLTQPPREAPAKPQRPAGSLWEVEEKGTDFKNPRGTALSSGHYNVLVFETGASRSMLGDRLITRFDPKRLGGQCGMSFYFYDGDKLHSLQPAPLFDDRALYSSRLCGAFACIRAESGTLESSVTTLVSTRDMGEKRVVRLKNRGNTAVEGTLAVYFEPVLEKSAAYFAHPAFSKLAVETEITDGVLIKRRGSELAAFFASDAETGYDTSRERALGRGGELAMLSALRKPAEGSEGSVLDPCVLARVKVRLAPNEEKEISFALALGPEPEEACRRILKNLKPQRESRLDSAAFALGLGLREVEETMKKLCLLTYPPISPNANAGGGRSLWQYGISGDYPILVYRADSVDAAMMYIKKHALLSICGVKSDLALIVNDGGDYRRPMTTAIHSGIKAAGLESLPGVHIVDESVNVEPLLDMNMDGEFGRDTAPPEQPPQLNVTEEKGKMEWYFEENGTFVIKGCGKLPCNSWSMILANEGFGAIMTDAGTGHLWSVNARENRLTPWINDSLATWGPERILINGKSAFAALDGEPYTIRYGFGFAQWEKCGIRMTAFVPNDIKARVIILENMTGRPVNMKYFMETEDVLSTKEENEKRMTVKRPSNHEFIGEDFVLFTGSKANNFTEIIIDNDFCFTVGVAVKQNNFTEINAETAALKLEETKAFWRRLVLPRSFASPYGPLNDYMNGWALYQTIACRIMGRTSIYQSGGAYGFRDQLQDVCAVMETAPELAKKQIISACRHQYIEGDVQHWWHPTTTGDRGVRTRCSDDLLWLPYAVCEFIEQTGDRTILDEQAEYISSPILSAEERDRYEKAERAEETDSVMVHCTRAIEMVMARGLGAHGLPFIGDGDWNDGYSRVGIGGRGESVWLAWFAALVMRRFAGLCGEKKAGEFQSFAEKLMLSAADAWDTDRFIRGYFDDGTPLGAVYCAEGSIDSVAQSFAALAGCPDEHKVKTALKTAVDILFDREHNVVKLLDPPFSGAEPNPGYISRYPEGVRENGGQYTHAAIWLAMACFETGMRPEGLEILLALLPRSHDERSYRVEPYVLAADVYSNPQHIGRGGWSWYTGAAGWYYRAVKKYLPEYFNK